jgi:hypothetical protein
MMENITFKTQKLLAYWINFYFILLDAETKNDITFNDHL